MSARCYRGGSTPANNQNRRKPAPRYGHAGWYRTRSSSEPYSSRAFPYPAQESRDGRLRIAADSLRAGTHQQSERAASGLW